MIEALAEDKGETEVSSEANTARFSDDLDKKQIVMETARAAVDSLGGKAIQSGIYSVLLHPRVGAQILSLLAPALSEDAVLSPDDAPERESVR